MGFDAVQIPLLDINSFDPGKMRIAMNDLGLTCYISAGLKKDMDVTSDDLKKRQKGIDFLKRCVQIANKMQSPFLSGSFHSVFGMKSEHLIGNKEWEHSAQCLREVAREAQKYDLLIVLEPINRYESFNV